MERALRDGREAIIAGKAARAIQILRRADPQTKDRRTAELLAAAHSRRGLERCRAGKIDLARQDYVIADKTTPGKEHILQSLGVICMELQRTDSAERYMTRLLKINAENGVALGVLARIAAGRNDNVKASDMYKKASRAAPERQDYSRMAEKLSKEAKVEAGFIVQARGKFEVKFERGKSAGVERAVQTVLGYLEQASRDLESLLGAKPVRRISVVLDLPSFSGEFASSPDPSVVRRGYAQSLMLVGHLKRTGSNRQLKSLLREINSGTDVDVALRLVYRHGMKDLLRAALR